MALVESYMHTLVNSYSYDMPFSNTKPEGTSKNVLECWVSVLQPSPYMCHSKVIHKMLQWSSTQRSHKKSHAHATYKTPNEVLHVITLIQSDVCLSKWYSPCSCLSEDLNGCFQQSNTYMPNLRHTCPSKVPVYMPWWCPSCTCPHHVYALMNSDMHLWCLHILRSYLCTVKMIFAAANFHV